MCIFIFLFFLSKGKKSWICYHDSFFVYDVDCDGWFVWVFGLLSLWFFWFLFLLIFSLLSYTKTTNKNEKKQNGNKIPSMPFSVLELMVMGSLLSVCSLLSTFATVVIQLILGKQQQKRKRKEENLHIISFRVLIDNENIFISFGWWQKSVLICACPCDIKLILSVILGWFFFL